MFNPALLALALALPATVLAPSAMAAAFDDLSVGVGVSTLGYGVDLNSQFSERFSASAGYNAFSIGGDEDTDDVRYQGDLKFNNATVKLSWHPLAGGFQVSAGVVVGDIRAAVTGSPRAGGVYEFNGVQYTAADVGQLRGRVEIKDTVAPYLGLGYRSRGAGLGFFAEIGVISAKTAVQLSATGLAADPQFQQNLEQERRQLQDKADLSLYPVLGMGLTYRF
ncbi:hypothetical protein [Stenotrophomonas sp. YIM B06876]|uniref:hypothetical protein n=1 Tax=Stenotrophomonas sp. YIM B06876 TaxID=3060211 RepID=UPI002738285C|nr:hypothetical protein [Stenotrophomonas sp. YIM B06876]